jgi:hypothetical protein
MKYCQNTGIPSIHRKNQGQYKEKEIKEKNLHFIDNLILTVSVFTALFNGVLFWRLSWKLSLVYRYKTRERRKQESKLILGPHPREQGWPPCWRRLLNKLYLKRTYNLEGGTENLNLSLTRFW